VAVQLKETWNRINTVESGKYAEENRWTLETHTEWGVLTEEETVLTVLTV